MFPDTATLYPISIADLLLRTAELGIVELLWSEHLLAEVLRVLTEKKNLPKKAAEYFAIASVKHSQKDVSTTQHINTYYHHEAAQIPTITNTAPPHPLDTQTSFSRPTEPASRYEPQTQPDDATQTTTSWNFSNGIQQKS